MKFSNSTLTLAKANLEKKPTLFLGSVFQKGEREFWAKIFLLSLDDDWEEEITISRILEVVQENGLGAPFEIIMTSMFDELWKMVDEGYLQCVSWSSETGDGTFKVGNRLIEFYESYLA